MANRISFILLLMWRHLRRFSQEPLWHHSGCLFTNKQLCHIILWNPPFSRPIVGKFFPNGPCPGQLRRLSTPPWFEGVIQDLWLVCLLFVMIYLIFNQCWKYLWPFPERCAMRVAPKIGPLLFSCYTMDFKNSQEKCKTTGGKDFKWMKADTCKEDLRTRSESDYPFLSLLTFKELYLTSSKIQMWIWAIFCF